MIVNLQYRPLDVVLLGEAFFILMLNVIMLSVVMVRCHGAGLLNICGRICNNVEHNF
jgi:hypothetical protein